MKSRYYLLGFFSLVLCPVQAQKGFSLKDVLSKKKVEVLYDGKLLTAYCYFDSTEKPVLFPIIKHLHFLFGKNVFQRKTLLRLH